MVVERTGPASGKALFRMPVYAEEAYEFARRIPFGAELTSEEGKCLRVKRQPLSTGNLLVAEFADSSYYFDRLTKEEICEIADEIFEACSKAVEVGG